MMRTRTLLLAVGVALCAWDGVFAGEKAPPGLPGLTVRDGRFIKDGKPYRGVGANYYDLFLRVLRHRTNTTSLTEISRLSKAGIPFVRFAGPYSAQEWKPYFENREEYLRCMDQVVRAAEREGMGLIPSMFWTLVLSDMAGEPRDQWGNPDSTTMARMRQYTADLVTRYKDSPAIWAWEFGNEVNLLADLPNAAEHRKAGGTERDDIKSAHMVVMFSEFAKEVRRHDAHRPIISGNSHPRAAAWHNTSERSWKPDTREQWREIVLRDNPAPLDVIGIHIYGGAPASKELGAWTTNRLDYLRAAKRLAGEVNRPLFVGEFGLAAREDKAAVRAEFEELIAAMEQGGADLAAFWVFDLASQSNDWSVTFENERAYMIRLTAEANRRWNAAALSGAASR